MNSKYLLSILFSITVIMGNAQTFTNYTTVDGLVNNTVNCLAIADNNDVWFGTQEGVSKFDGINWTSHTTSTNAGLVHNTIKAMAIDDDGNVWVGTDYGVSTYDGNNWTTYTETDGLADNRIKYITVDLEGNIWFGNNDGVSVYDGSIWLSYTTTDGLPFGGVSFIAIDSSGNKCLGTGLGGMIVFDGVNFTAVTEDEGLLNDKVRSIVVDGDNNKWIGTADGISIFDSNNNWVENHTRMFTLPAPDTLNPVEDVQMDSKGRIWSAIYVDYLVTEGGISMYNGVEWTDYDMSDGLIGPVVRRIAIDDNDVVWVATSTGVSKISDMPAVGITSYEHQAELNVFPNPCTDRLVIQGDDIQSVEVIDITGKTIAQQSSNFSSLVNLEMNAYPSGIYFVKIYFDGSVFTQKVVKR